MGTHARAVGVRQKAKRRLHGAAEPGIGRCPPRPAALDKPAGDDPVGTDEARFQGAQDAQAGMGADPRIDSDAGERLVEQGRVLAARDRPEGLGRRFEFAHEPLNPLAGMIRVEPVRATVGRGRQPFGEGPVGRHDGAGVGGGGQGLSQRCHAFPELSEPPFKAGQPGPPLDLPAQLRLDIRKFVPREDPTDDVVLKRPDVRNEAMSAVAPGRPRMLEQRQEVEGPAVAGGRPDGEAKQHGGRRIAQRFAARVVDLDIPAPERGPHPAGELPVAGDEGRGLARRFERFAHQDRDGAGLFDRIAGFNDLQAVEARVDVDLRHRLRPPVRRRGRPHHFRQQPGPGDRFRGRLGPGPVANLRAIRAKRLQQLFQAELRVGFAERLPRFRVDGAIKASQDDFAAGQLGHGRNEGSGGRNRTRRSGHDHGAARRGPFPHCGLVPQQPGAPGNGIHASSLGQDTGPVIAEDLEKLERLLPMFGQVLVHQGFEVGQLHVLVLQRVQQGTELAGEARRLRERTARALAAHPGDQLGQEQLAAHGSDGRPQLGHRRPGPLVVVPAKAEFLFADLPQRRDPGEQERPRMRR